MGAHASLRDQKRLLRVLVADDAASVNDELTAMISEIEGITVFGCAQNSAKVLNLVQTVHPDAVILDLHVPGRSGLRALLRIKQAQPGITVIVLSHYDLPPLRQACLDAGAEYFFWKTAALDRLRETLTSLMQPKYQQCSHVAARRRGNGVK